MFRKNKILLGFLALTLSTSTLADEAIQEDGSGIKRHTNFSQNTYTAASPLITSALIAEWVLDGAKSAIKGGAKSFITSLLFGNGNTGPQIVRIHQDDLDKIESMVQGIVLTSDVEEAKSQFESFGDTLEYYRSSAEVGNLDESIVPVLLNHTTSLKNHRAYKTYYNPKAFALTSSYSLIASMSIAVLTERKLQGYVSYGFVQSQAANLAVKLSELGAAADAHIASLGRVRHFGSGCYNFSNKNGYNITETLPEYTVSEMQVDELNENETPMAPQGCFVIASFPGQGSKSFNADILGMMEAEELAWEFLNNAKNAHREIVKGANFNQILFTLNNF